MAIVIRLLVIAVIALVVFIAVAWAGLQVKAAAFPPLAPSTPPRRLPIPDGLPAPVERFARAVYGDSLPEVQSAILHGRARLAPTGLLLPARFRFYYDAVSASYYHEIQVTWFTLPILRIHERNLAGHTQLDLSIIGKVNDQPNTNRAAIQGYWAEALAWLPAIVFSDGRLRWEAIDATTARLYLPELDAVEAFTVHFDADSGLMTGLETQRYQNEADPARHRWTSRALEWRDLDGVLTMVRSQLQWDASAPWAYWGIDQIALNTEVASRLAQFGGDVP